MQNRESIEKETGLTVANAVITASRSGVAKIVVNNYSGLTQHLPKGACLGEVEMAQVLSVPDPGEGDLYSAKTAMVKQTTSETEDWRKEKPFKIIALPESPPPELGLLQISWQTIMMSSVWRMVSAEKRTLCT